MKQITNIFVNILDGNICRLSFVYFSAPSLDIFKNAIAQGPVFKFIVFG